MFDVIGSIVILLSHCCLPNDKGPARSPKYFFLEPPLRGRLCQREVNMADIESLSIRTDVNHRFATTTVTQRFVNRLPVNSTSVFNMPLPKSAYIVNLTA